MLLYLSIVIKQEHWVIMITAEDRNTKKRKETEKNGKRICLENVLLKIYRMQKH